MLPYLGKKWRQSNIHVVSAIYEHLRPEPVETWLVSKHRDADVDDEASWEDLLERFEQEEAGMSSGYSSWDEGQRGCGHFPDLERPV